MYYICNLATASVKRHTAQATAHSSHSINTQLAHSHRLGEHCATEGAIKYTHTPPSRARAHHTHGGPDAEHSVRTSSTCIHNEMYSSKLLPWAAIRDDHRCGQAGQFNQTGDRMHDSPPDICGRGERSGRGHMCRWGRTPLLSHTLWSSLFLSMSRSQSNSTFALHVEMSELNLS